MASSRGSRSDGGQDRLNEFWRHFRAAASDDNEHHLPVVLVAILTSLVLVTVLVVLTITIGRTPESASGAPAGTNDKVAPTQATSYPSPDQTGLRYTASPIITGVPQLTATPMDTPSDTPSAETQIGSAHPVDVCYEGEPCWDEWNCEDGSCMIETITPSIPSIPQPSDPLPTVKPVG